MIAFLTLSLLFASTLLFYFRKAYLVDPLYTPKVVWLFSISLWFIFLPPLVLCFRSIERVNRDFDVLRNECTTLIATLGVSGSKSGSMPTSRLANQNQVHTRESTALLSSSTSLRRPSHHFSDESNDRGGGGRGGSSEANFGGKICKEVVSQEGVEHSTIAEDPGLGAMKLAAVLDRAPCELTIAGRKLGSGDVGAIVVAMATAQFFNAIGLAGSS
jgi:hypothetical protein